MDRDGSSNPNQGGFALLMGLATPAFLVLRSFGFLEMSAQVAQRAIPALLVFLGMLAAGAVVLGYSSAARGSRLGGYAVVSGVGSLLVLALFALVLFSGFGPS